MFTDCPSCNRQFRIRAGQLSAAGGLVQCGFCGKQFNALERLHDRPLPDTGAPAGETVTEEHPGIEPWFDIAVPERATPSAHDSGSPAEEMEAGPETARHEATPSPSRAAESETDHTDHDDDRDEPPEWLLEEKPRTGRRGRILWSAGILVLILVLAGQAAWFQRDWFLMRWPQLQPRARQVCEYFQCELIRNRDLSAITVVNRDVRDHPRYRDALLVNATITNESQERQPFPLVQLSLFDTAGNIIAYRRFRPDEYLDESMAIERGMQPQDPVHIVLEVTGPTRGAVSFEFRFLKQS